MSNPTDTNQASLFELCKEVAKRTDWLCDEDESDFYFYWEANEGGDFSIRYRNECPYYSKDEYYPLYTSDYLLAKLPKTLKHHEHYDYLTLWSDSETDWNAAYELDNDCENFDTAGVSPLKALLKLTIALSEAGELNG